MSRYDEFMSMYPGMITNKDLIAFGRKQEEDRLQDRCIYLLHRIRVMEDDMKFKLQVVQQLRVEYDDLKRRRGELSQLQLEI